MTGKFLLSILFCLLSIPAWAQVTGTAPELRFIESDQAAALGRWRIRVIGDHFVIEKNTAALRDYSTKTVPFSIDDSGNLTLIGTVGGITTLTATTLAGTLSTASQPNITGLGTIVTGIWHGTTIEDGYLAPALTGKTYNALTLSALATGYSIAGGTASRTLTVDETVSISAKAPLASPVFTGSPSVSGTSPTFALTDITASAKSLTIKVDANALTFAESAAPTMDLLTFELSGGALGVPSLSSSNLAFGVVTVTALTTTMLTASSVSVDLAVFTADPVFSRISSPAATDPCTAGTFTWDSTYGYICTASAVWKRFALTGGY
jgi:hypothetical protein